MTTLGALQLVEAEIGAAPIVGPAVLVRDPVTGLWYVSTEAGLLVPMTIDVTIPDFVGATSLANGVAGLVPAPLIADELKFLKGDGTWATPPTVIPATPACILYNSGNESIPDATVTPIPYDIEIVDTNAFHAANSTDIVIPTALGGIYVVTFVGNIAQAATGSAVFIINLNGAQVARATFDNGGSRPVFQTITQILKVVPTDIISTAIYQDSGGPLDAAGGVTQLRFAVARIGT